MNRQFSHFSLLSTGERERLLPYKNTKNRTNYIRYSFEYEPIKISSSYTKNRSYSLELYKKKLKYNEKILLKKYMNTSDILKQIRPSWRI